MQQVFLPYKMPLTEKITLWVWDPRCPSLRFPKVMRQRCPSAAVSSGAILDWCPTKAISDRLCAGSCPAEGRMTLAVSYCSGVRRRRCLAVAVSGGSVPRKSVGGGGVTGGVCQRPSIRTIRRLGHARLMDKPCWN